MMCHTIGVNEIHFSLQRRRWCVNKESYCWESSSIIFYSAQWNSIQGKGPTVGAFSQQGARHSEDYDELYIHN
jgi:hypothetical protein